MNLTSDSCGGLNPLVSLSEQYKSSSRFTSNTQTSHSITELLSQLQLDSNATAPLPAALSVQNAAPEKQAVSFQKHSSNIKPHWRPLQRPHSFTQSLQRPPRPTSKLYNEAFHDWVGRYHPEILYKTEIEDTLSHELAEEWLKDFDLDKVLDIKSLSEAEKIVEEWIKEFQLGQRLSHNRLSFEQRVALESDESEYTYVTRTTRDATQDIDMGIDMIKQGDLLAAISIFEALVQQDHSNGEAWFYLGLSHQQAENEDMAIVAFKNVGEQDPCYTSTLLHLAASYQNENKHNSATLCLLNWLKLSHPQLVGLDDNLTNAALVRSKFEEIPRTKYNDVEIQTGLGILSCVLQEPDVAASHFRAAVAASPQDFMLWNMLGASLANSHRSLESIEAYRRALNLSPGYIRARYNLGIACLNLGANREGIEHFMTCLKQQETTSVWAILRIALCLGQHYGLLEYVDKRDLKALCRAFDM